MSNAALENGVWGVLATPYNGSTLDVDEPSLANIAEHYASIGVAGLTVLGVFGEAARLASEERNAVLETVVDACELPLVVGATGLSTAPVVEEVRMAQAVVGDRLAGVMVQANSPDPEALAGHLHAVHEATGVGLVVQDYPLASGVHIGLPALVTALRATPGVVGVKAEAPPTPVAVATLTESLDVPVFGGLGGIGLLDELAAGAAGAMTGFSYPEGLLACVTAWRQEGYVAAREAFLPYLPLVNFEQQARIALAIRKECLRERGLVMDADVRPPAVPMPETMLAQLRQHLAAVPVGAGVA